MVGARARIQAVLLGMWVLVGVSTAWAAPPTKVYVVPTKAYKGEVSSLIPERVDDTLKGRLKASPAVEVLPPYNPTASTAGAAPANASIDEARRLYTSGIGQMVAESFPEAAESFQGAIDRYEGNLGEVQDYEILKDALLRLGLAWYKAGQGDKGHASLRLYLSLADGDKIDTSDFPAPMLDFLDKERKRLKNAGGGKLSITSEPSGAEVVLDGELLGQTPMEIEDMAAGLHYVVVRGKGPFPFVQRVEVSGRGRKAEVKATFGGAGGAQADGGGSFMAEIDARISAGQVDGELNPFLKELATRTGAQAVIFSVMRKDGADSKAMAFLYDPAGDRVAVLDPERVSADMSNVTLACYQLSNRIVAGLKAFPEDKLLSGDPFAVVVAAAPPEVKPEPKPAPVAKPEPKPEPKPAPVVKPEPKPAPVAKPEPKPEPAPVAKPEPRPEPKPEVKPEPRPEPAVVAAPTPAVGEPGDPAASVFGGGAPGVGDDLKDGEDQWYQTWWFWAGVGAVAITGVIAVGALSFGEEESTGGFSATVTW